MINHQPDHCVLSLIIIIGIPLSPAQRDHCRILKPVSASELLPCAPDGARLTPIGLRPVLFCFFVFLKFGQAILVRVLMLSF